MFSQNFVNFIHNSNAIVDYVVSLEVCHTGMSCHKPLEELILDNDVDLVERAFGIKLEVFDTEEDLEEMSPNDFMEYVLNLICEKYPKGVFAAVSVFHREKVSDGIERVNEGIYSNVYVIANSMKDLESKIETRVKDVIEKMTRERVEPDSN